MPSRCEGISGSVVKNSACLLYAYYECVLRNSILTEVLWLFYHRSAYIYEPVSSS